MRQLLYVSIISLKWIYPSIYLFMGFPGGAEVKASACNVGDLGSIPGLGRSPGEGNVNTLLYSCLENPMDGGAWWATIHGSQRVRHDWATSLSLSLYWFVSIKEIFVMCPIFQTMF